MTRPGAFAAALCVTSAALAAALEPVCTGKAGDALDECLGALCHPTSQTGLQGYGACWENGKYKWAETGYYNRGDACGTTAKDFMCHRCPVGFNTHAATAGHGYTTCEDKNGHLVPAAELARHEKNAAKSGTAPDSAIDATSSFGVEPDAVCYDLASCGCTVALGGELQSCNPLPGTQTIDLSGELPANRATPITSIKPGAFDGCGSIIELNISAQQISKLPKGAFSGLEKLHTLTLRQNAISEIANGAFHGIPAVQLVDLGLNDLFSLEPDTFRGLTVRTVVLSSNPMTRPGYKCPSGTIRVTLVPASADVCYRTGKPTPATTTTTASTTTTTATATTTTTAAAAPSTAKGTALPSIDTTKSGPPPALNSIDQSSLETCIMEAWGAWSSCTKSCGPGGERSRTRTVAKAAQLCPFKTREMVQCDDRPCPKDLNSGNFTIGALSTVVQQGRYPWLLGGGAANRQPDAAACKALCARLPECMYGTFVTADSELPIETHSYSRRATFGECWLSAHTHAEAKKCDVPCKSFRKLSLLPTPAPTPAPALVNPTHRARALRMYERCDCDPAVRASNKISCRQDPFGGHLFVTHLGAKFTTQKPERGTQHNCKIVYDSHGAGRCRCCTCRGREIMHGVRDLANNMHVDVSTYLFGGGRSNLVPSLALCKLMCYRSPRCTTGTYIMEGTRMGQCWLSGESVEAERGAAVPLLNCGVPCRSFVNDHEYAQQRQSSSPINLLREAGGTPVQAPEPAAAGLPPIESEKPPMAVALDEQTPQQPARTQLHRIWSEEKKVEEQEDNLQQGISLERKQEQQLLEEIGHGARRVATALAVNLAEVSSQLKKSMAQRKSLEKRDQKFENEEFRAEEQQLASAPSAPVTAVALDEDVEDIQDAQDLDLAALRGGN